MGSQIHSALISGLTRQDHHEVSSLIQPNRKWSFQLETNNFEAAYGYLFAGSLESANSSILAPCDLFKEVVGKKIRILC